MKEKSQKSEKKHSAAGSNKAAGKRKNSEKDSLIQELKILIKDVDEEGLLFLIKQAHVLIYNKKAEEYNAKSEKIAKKTTIKKPPFSDKLSMEIKEADDNSSFIFVINRERKFFTLEEMRKIVRICHGSSDAKDASKKLYAWYKNNRGDVLNDIGIDNSLDPSLETMYKYIIKRYTVKK
ncbi:MAG: hypothetical protein JW864_02285 [Spirochaetes bacterium]|nr:hypothetical protein [Spirochaetota bacterium]